LSAPEKAPGLKFHADHPWMASLVSPAFAVGLPLIYVLCVMVGTRLQANYGVSHKTFLKRYIQPVYNVVQIVVCAWMVWGLWPKDVWRNPFSLNTLPSKNVEFFVFVHYLTKYLDWCDTAFMILGKSFRQVSFLQVFHHATIGMVWGLVLDAGWGSGTVQWGAFINSVTHVLLYSHYLWTSLGYKNPLKKHLFMFQISQFASCIVHAVLVFGGHALGSENIYPKHLSYLQVMYHPVMIFLFSTQLHWVPGWLVGEAATLEIQKTMGHKRGNKHTSAKGDKRAGGVAVKVEDRGPTSVGKGRTELDLGGGYCCLCRGVE
jgi:elongation of very long chain fatty acids protein 4